MTTADGPIERELAALRVAEMRRYEEGNPPPFDLAGRDRACALLAEIGHERIDPARPLLLRLLRHSSREIIAAAAKSLIELGESLDPATLPPDDALPAVRALLIVFGPTAAFDRVAKCFETDHPLRWKLTMNALYAVFQEEMGVNRDSKLAVLVHEPRWIALAIDAEREAAELRKLEKGEPTNEDRSNRALRGMLQDLLKLAPKDLVKDARKRAAKG